MVNNIDWIEFRTENVQKTAEFYEKLFGWKVIQKLDIEGTPYWIFDTFSPSREENIRRGAIWLRPNEAPRIVVYILVDDINKKLKKVKKFGGKVIKEKTHINRGRFMAEITDPNDNMVALWEEKG
ncbi:MAG: hypothetical protein EU547_00685 [Promethearchaeota archaeon]|nr:MAG: hypothetical protein EU547_00685 [Candidatus Lokiarchaeota archaeon]